MSTNNVSVIRQNFHEACEAALNRQVNMELCASYSYQAMAFYFDRDNVALPGFSKFFKHNSDEEREHAEKFMTYLNKRGGRLTLNHVVKPEKEAWASGCEALQDALALERNVNQSLLELHALAGTHNDAHLSDFLESEFLTEQVDAIKELGDMITKAKRCGPGLGEYMYDKELQA